MVIRSVSPGTLKITQTIYNVQAMVDTGRGATSMHPLNWSQLFFCFDAEKRSRRRPRNSKSCPGSAGGFFSLHKAP